MNLGDILYMKDRMNLKGVLLLICIFISFYFISSAFLEKFKHDEEIIDEGNAVVENDPSYEDEKVIVDNLYQDVRMLYDVVNSKFKVSQEDVIVINNITYKRITNFNEVIGGIFTENGLSKYISDLGSYFAYANDTYYIAGNLVSYQTYYFRGDTTNIYVQNVTENQIEAIIYEKWTSNNKNTLATIIVVKENDSWLIEDITILSNE